MSRNKIIPPTYAQEHISIDQPATDIAFDVPAFDEAIRAQGVRLVHYRALPCPVGMTDINDNRRPMHDTCGCSNGFIYERVGCISAQIIGNGKSREQDDMGFWDNSTVQATFCRSYNDSGLEFTTCAFDRFFLDEESITVPTWERFLHHQSGKDRVKYPVITVEGPIVDYRGEKYVEGIDFKICKGQLEWGNRQPAQQVDVGPLTGPTRGAVCSIRYRYQPYFYVGHMPHEIRVAQVIDHTTGTRTVVRAPQTAILHREFVTLNIDNNPENKIAPEPIPGTGIDANVLRATLSNMYLGWEPK